MKAALYARVSTTDQTCENQLADLRRFVAGRGWEAVEFVDHAVSGSRESRPSLDRLMAAARRRQIDAVVVWRLDRLGRSLRHLVTSLEELQSLGVAFVSLGEGIDATTPAGRLLGHLLASIAQFERDRVSERVRAGLARARNQGKRLGRPRRRVSESDLEAVAGLSLRAAATKLRVSKSVIHRARLSQKPLCNQPAQTPICEADCDC